MGHNFTITPLVTTLAICFGTFGGFAVAATDGQIGATSEGSLRISLTVDPQVQLSNVQDIRLSTDGLATASSWSSLCIYSKTGHYQLQAQGSGTDAGFKLSQADTGVTTNHRAYQVRYDDGSGFKPLLSGVPLSGLAGADPHSPSCGTTGLNGQLEVSSRQDSEQRQHPGHYTGTLTLLVAPE